jgi:hypothetical protein
MTEELIVKFLQNKCSADEINEVVDWFRTDADKHLSQLLIKEVWNKYSPDEELLKNIEFERILDKLHHKINISNSKKLNTEHNLPKRNIGFSSFLVRAAAILFIPLLGVLVYTFSFSDYRHYVVANKSQMNIVPTLIEIEAPVGSRTNIELADGTKVWLNHGSKLKYPSQFNAENREVFLTGEGYFEVAHNPQRKFIVKTEKIQVTALGTSFNVQAYSNKPFVKTTLVEGKVLIEKRAGANKAIKICEMQPNQLMKFNIEKNSYSCLSTNIGKQISWKDGILVFDNDPIDEVADRLSRWFNVEFIIKNPKVKDYLYTAKFIDETLPQILELMEIATPISYKITTRKKLPDGTFSKRKVCINMKRES